MECCGTAATGPACATGFFLAEAGETAPSHPVAALEENGELDTTPLVSIVIPVFNQVAFTRQCLQSILLNPPPLPFEIIVVDDASTDGTQDFLHTCCKDEPRIRVVRNEANLGFAASCNRGAAIAGGEYVLFLNNDTEPLSDWLSPLVGVLDKHADIGIVGPKLIFPDRTIQHCGKVWQDSENPSSQPEHIYYRAPADAPHVNKSRDYQMMTGACMLVRKNEFLAIGPFDECYVNGWEDDDLCYAYRAQGKRVFYCAESEVVHHQSKTLGATIHKTLDMLVLYEKKREFCDASGNAVEGNEKVVSFLDDKLSVNRARFDRNRKRFFDKWGNMVVRDDFTYYREDGLPLPSRENTASHVPIKPDSSASIIILTFNSEKTIANCLSSVARHLRPDDEVIVVDNASEDATVEFVKRFLDGKKPFRLMENPTNLGFSAGTNVGIAASNKPLVVLLNPDTIVTENWLDRLAAHFTAADIGAVGPVSNYVAERQKMQLYMKKELAPDTPVDEIAGYLYAWNKGSAVETKLLIGFCMMLRRDVFEKVGLLDEALFLGNDDLELSWRLSVNGCRLKIATDTFIYHEWRQSFSTVSKESVSRLVQQSTDALYAKLQAHYGAQNVPTPQELWGMGTVWFKPASAAFNPNSKISALLKKPNTRGQMNNPTKASIHPLVSIVILTFNQLDYTRECIASIRRHTPGPHEIIFVDNGSQDGTVQWLRELVQNNRHYRLIENRQNLGFAKGCNQGIESASGDYILLLNNDVIVTPEWLSGMLECYSHVPDAGIVGPMTNNISGIQKVPCVGYDNLDRLDDFAQGFRRENRHRRIPFRRIVGFCMLFKRSLVDRIGLLDETFGTGNFEDDDFCYRAALEGYRNIIAADVFIHHFGSVSFTGNNINFAAAMTVNMGLFDQKWHDPELDDATAVKILAVRTLEKAEMLNQRWEVGKAVDVILQEGIKYAPDDKRFYYALAEYLLDAKRFKDALELLNEIPEEVQEARRFALAGFCREGMGLRQEAAELAALALALEPDYPLALNLKGTVAYSSGNKSDAEALFQKAIDSDPGYGEPYTNLGVMKWSEGEHKDALALFERGFVLSPTMTDVVNTFHSAICELGEFERGEPLFRNANSLYPHNKGIAFFLVDILIRQGKYGEAMKEIEAALVNFGADDGTVAAALQVREKLGPSEIADSSGTERKETVSLCMIVKNEEKDLPKSLLSLTPLVDEIIVVDTGATDRTNDIARIFGARVFDFQWSGDFSAARNFAASKAHGDWILAMDADEVISPRDYTRFNALATNSKTAPVAYEFTTRNYITKVNVEKWTPNDGTYFREEAGAGWVPSDKARLFPNMKGVVFENPVHEKVEPSLVRLRIPVVRADVPIHHYGKLNPDKDIAKGEHYYLLGIKKLTETGGDLDAICELAIQAGMLERYDEAIELWHKALVIKPDLPVAFFNLGYAHMQLNQFSKSLAASKKAMELKPDFREAISNYCIGEVYCGDAEKAIARLEETVRETPENPGALLVLAIAYSCSGEKEKGSKHFAAIKRMQIECSAFVNDFVKKLVAAGRSEYAGRLLEAALANNVSNEDTIGLLEELATQENASIMVV
ncbi:MAG: family 2 glycosyl [Geobacteraceae bacterium]|nr:MAG: family 2 glycosyl [Geobacteraceae bacterium]